MKNLNHNVCSNTCRLQDKISAIICVLLVAPFCAGLAHHLIYDVGLVAIALCIGIIALIESVISFNNPKFSWIGLLFHICAFACFLYIAHTNGTLFEDVAYEPQLSEPKEGLYHKPADFGCGTSPAWQWWLFVAEFVIRTVIIQPLILMRNKKKD